MPTNLRQHLSTSVLSPPPGHRKGATKGRSNPTADSPELSLDDPEISETERHMRFLTHLAEVGEHTVVLVHEMRSPLSVILNGLRLSLRVPLPHVIQQRLTLALEETERINRMANDVLVFAHHAYYPDFHWNNLDLNQLMEEILQLMAQMPMAEQCQIHFEASKTPVWVRGDRDKLKQVVINLLVNACEAIEETGCIRCQVSLAADQGYGMLQVRNDTLPKRPFAKPPSSVRRTLRNAKNLGLGLLLVRQLVDAHGGKFWLESSHYNTIATVQLPVRNDHA